MANHVIFMQPYYTSGENARSTLKTTPFIYLPTLFSFWSYKIYATSTIREFVWCEIFYSELVPTKTITILSPRRHCYPSTSAATRNLANKITQILESNWIWPWKPCCRNLFWEQRQIELLQRISLQSIRSMPREGGRRTFPSSIKRQLVTWWITVCEAVTCTSHICIPAHHALRYQS